MSQTAIRDVVIRVAIEQSQSSLRSDSTSGLANAQRELKETTQQAELALKEEGLCLDNLKLKAQESGEETLVLGRKSYTAWQAMEGESTAARKLSDILGESGEHAEHAAHAHHGLGHSIHRLARPFQMAAHGAMHLAHSYAMLTAANEEDEQQMARSLMKYEGAIMAMSGMLHLLPAVAVGFELWAGTASAAATATWAAIAPLLPFVAAAVALGVAVYALADHFDVFGKAAARAKEEANQAREAFEATAKARTEFEMARFTAQNKAHDEQDSLHEKTGRGSEREKFNAGMHDRAKERADLNWELARKQAEFKREQRENREALWAKEDEVRKGNAGLGRDSDWNIHGEDAIKERNQKQDKEIAEFREKQMERENQIAEQIKQQKERIAELDKKDVESLERHQEHLNKIVEKERESLHIAHEKLRAAEDSKKASETHLSGLNEAQLGEIARINAKVAAGGTANKFERDFVMQHGDEKMKHWAEQQQRDQFLRKHPGGGDALGGALHARGEQGLETDIKSGKSAVHEAGRALGEAQKRADENEKVLRDVGTKAVASIERVMKEGITLLRRVEALANEHERILKEKAHHG